MYHSGRGVAKDNDKAHYWISRAASNGSVKAQSWISRKIFTECINKFLAKCNSDSLFVFKGFTLDFYSALNSLISHLSGKWDGLYPDVRKINGYDILLSMTNLSGLKWCFYEEFSAVSIILDLSVYKGKITLITNDLFDDYYPVDSSIPVEVFENEFADSDSDSDSILQKYYSDYKHDSGDKSFLISFVDRHSGLKNIHESGFFAVLGDENNKFESELESETINISELQHIKYKLIRGRLHDRNFCVEYIKSEYASNLPGE